MNTCENRPPITPLHELEMRSALRQKAARGEITDLECEAVIAQLGADLNSGVFERPSIVWSDVFAMAESLSAAHGIKTLCRSLDTLHVSLAKVLGAMEFCTFDHRQSLMATGAGLVVME